MYICFVSLQTQTSALIRSVESGNIKLFKTLSDKSSNFLNFVDFEGNNLLHHAVLSGRKKMAKFISRRCECKDLSTQWNVYGLAPVHLALLSNQPELVELLLWITGKSKSKDNVKTRDNLNLLQYAVMYSHPKMVKIYLNNFGSRFRQESINECNENGQTTMHLAAAQGSREMLAFLHNHGGDFGVRDKEGMLPFHHAISNGFIFTARFISNLMNRSPSEMINDDLNGSSCLLKACENSFDPVSVKNILKWGGDPFKIDALGNDAYDYASRNMTIFTELKEMIKLGRK